MSPKVTKFLSVRENKQQGSKSTSRFSCDSTENAQLSSRKKKLPSEAENRQGLPREKKIDAYRKTVRANLQKRAKKKFTQVMLVERNWYMYVKHNPLREVILRIFKFCPTNTKSWKSIGATTTTTKIQMKSRLFKTSKK